MAVQLSGSLELSGSLVISGSISTTGTVTISGSIASASYASNAELLDGLDSSVFVQTGSFNTVSSSFSTRVSAIEGKYATTGSNVFIGAQTITGSVLQSGSLSVNGCIVSTGQIVAQTINVQQVTSSIVYSCGSNIFGCALTNTQQFTGSVLVTGSLNVAGNTCVGGTITGTTVYGSTAICGGSVTGTCSVFSGNGLFGGSTNAGNAGTNTLSIGVPGTTAGGLQLWAATNQTHFIQFGDSTVSADNYRGYISYAHGTDTLALGSSSTDRLTINSNGIATFACQICAPTVYIENCLLLNQTSSLINTTGPRVEMSGVGNVTATSQASYSVFANHGINPSWIGYLVFYKSRGTTQGSVTSVADGDSLGMIRFSGADGSEQIRTTEIYAQVDGAVSKCCVPSRIVFATAGNNLNGPVERFRITSTGIASFSCQVCAAGFYTTGNSCLGAKVSINSIIDPEVVLRVGVIGNTTDTITCSTGLRLFTSNNTAGQGVSLAFTAGSTKETGIILAAENISGQNGDFVIRTYAGGANYPERMRITSGGRVIVGTDTTHALEVFSSGDTEIGFSYSTKGNVYSKIIGDVINASPLGGDIAFQTATGGTLYERMRITCGGIVGINTNSTPTLGKLQVTGDNNQIAVHTDGTWSSIYFYNGSSNTAGLYASSTTTYLQGRGSGGLKLGGATSVDHLIITSTGIACFSNTVCSPCFATISDYRMKSNLRPIEGLSIIMNTKPYKFDYNYDCSTSFGMIAHELQEVVPEAVFGVKDGEVMQGVDYMKLLPITIKALQEQQCQICTQSIIIDQLKTCLGII